MESRKHERFKVWLPIQVSSDTIEAALGVTKDASKGGLSMAATEPLAVGTHVTLTFTLPDESERVVQAKIIRMDRNTEDPHGPWPFRVAVQFLTPIGDLDDVLKTIADDLAGAR